LNPLTFLLSHCADQSDEAIQKRVVQSFLRGKPDVSKRHIKFLGQNANGSFANPSNNADAFSIIE